MNVNVAAKVRESELIVKKCIGPKGVWASPTRYEYQCWTRDFVLATQELLLEQGKSDIVRTHLKELAMRQYDDGRMPIMFIDRPLKWLWKKFTDSVKNRRMSFLVQQYFSKDGIGQLSPWTRDSEILFMLGAARYEENTGDISAYTDYFVSHVIDARRYLEMNLMKDGLVFGGDWRDTRLDLGDKFLLTNNCLLHEAYKKLGFNGKAEVLGMLINQKFWTGAHYRDYLGVDDFDTLGNAFAILFDIAPKERWSAIIEGAEKLDTPYGYKLNGVTLPAKSPEEVEVMKRTNQFGVIWPFIHGFMILAALKAGREDIARRQFDKWTMLNGLYEFYDPTTGKGYGSTDQVWSAALYLRVAKALKIY